MRPTSSFHAYPSILKPYYEQDGITIYHGDAREILPGLTADVVLTDFPYGIGLDYGDEYEDSPENLDQLITDTLPLMRDAAPVVAFTCGVVNIWRYPPSRWILCWYQSDATSSTGYWGFNAWQPILVYGTDPFLSRRMGRRPDVIVTAVPKTGADKRLGHPCPKPIQAWRKIMFRVSPEEQQTILDPFVGSGSTLVAAKYSNRKAIGIEIDERYCEIAAGRLGQGLFDF